MRLRTQFKELFQIHCLHGYFKDNICAGARVLPTAQTRELLNRSRCLFRRTISGAVILSEVAEDGITMVCPFNDSVPLSFAVTGPLNQLAHITDDGPAESVPPDETVHYFSNVLDNGAIEFDNRSCMLLHPPASEVGAESLAVKPMQFVQPFPSPLTSAEIELYDALGMRVWKTQSADKPTRAISLNLSWQPERRYRLKINGAEQPDFFLSGSSAASMWGVVEIYPGGPGMSAIPETCRVVSLDGITTQLKAFAISLEARKSTWRYYIVSGSVADRNFDGYEIVGGPRRGSKANGGRTISFSAPMRQRLNGKEAWVFESLKPISLSEFPGELYEFFLKGKGKSDGIALPYGDSATTRLRKAQTSSTQSGNDSSGSPQYFSEIFVYL